MQPSEDFALCGIREYGKGTGKTAQRAAYIIFEQELVRKPPQGRQDSKSKISTQFETTPEGGKAAQITFCINFGKRLNVNHHRGQGSPSMLN